MTKRTEIIMTTAIIVGNDLLANAAGKVLKKHLKAPKSRTRTLKIATILGVVAHLTISNYLAGRELGEALIRDDESQSEKEGVEIYG